MKNWIEYYDNIAEQSSNRFEISEMHFKDGVAGARFFEHEQNRILQTLSKREKEGVLVDLGCCAGVIMELIKDKFEKCIGVDLSEKALLYAMESLPDCEFIHDDICNPTKVEDNMADYCITYGVLQFLSDEQVKDYLKSVAKICKSGAKVLVSRIPNKNYYDEYQNYREQRGRKPVLEADALVWNWITPEFVEEHSRKDFHFVPILPVPDAALPLKAFFDFVLIKK